MKCLKTVLVVIFLCFFAKRGLSQNKYVVEFSGQLRCKVQAELTLSDADTILRVSDYGAWSYEEGWAGFMKEITVTDPEGRPVSIRKNGKHTWRIQGKIPRMVRLSYIVDYSYADQPGWKDGPKSTSAFYDGKGLFLNAATLFIYQSENVSGTVSFNLPGNWKVSAPWKQRKNDHFFQEDSMGQFTKNILVVGVFASLTIQVANFHVSVAALGYKSNILPLIASAAKKIINDFVRTFHYRDTVNYVMVWFREDDWDTGEAYNNSYVAINPEVPANENRLVWSTMMAHEIFHYWLGKILVAEDWASSQWFSEGFTEYMASKSAVRNRIISPELYRDLMQHRLLLYTKFRVHYGTPYEDISLIEAGSKKSTHNAAIYDGGYTAALCLDLIILGNSNGKKSLKDFFVDMYAVFGKGSKKYTNADILYYLERAGGTEAAGFYKKYIEGKEMIHVNTYLKKIGLVAVNGFYVEKKARPKPGELALRKTAFGF